MRQLATAVGLAALVASACGGGAAPDSGSAGTVSVFAAASLTEAFGDEARAFESQVAGTHVVINFNASSTLAAQIIQGAPADLFASADAANMQRVVVAGYVAGAPGNFATNRLAIAVAPRNPRHVSGLADLARADLTIVLCAAEVPCGAYARRALAKAGVAVRSKSDERDVNSVVTKVAMGEADAGIVYATDVRASSGRVTGVEIPTAQNVVATYPAAALAKGGNPAGGRAFLDFLRSDRGLSILTGYGFAAP